MEQVSYQLPDGWHLETIGGVTSKLVTGKTPSTKKTEYYSSSEVDWFTPSDFGSTAVLNNSRRKLSSLAIEDGTIKKMPKGSILLVAIGATIGKVGIAEDESCFNQQVTGMYFKDKIHPKYAYYWLSYIKPEILAKSSQATLPIINQTGIKGLSFLYPEKKEQKRIAEKLDALLTLVDTAIEHLQKSVTLADALYASVLNELATGVNGKKIKLGELGKIIRGSSPRPKGDPRYYGGSVPRLMVADVTRDGRYVTPEIDFLTDEGALKSRPVPKGTLTIQVSGNPGMPAILAVDACIHDGFAALIEIKQESISIEYLYFSLLAVAEQNSQMAVGAIFRNLTTSQLREIKVVIPSYEKQLELVKQMDIAEQKVKALKTELNVQLEAICQLKASILDSAFKGEL